MADVRDAKMRTPLMLAVEGGYAQCTDVLLGCGSSVDLVDINQRTALHRAASRGFEDCVLPLLEAKASVRIADCNGKTPLHLSASGGHVNVLKMLIQHCDSSFALSCTDAQSCTPLHWAAFNGTHSVLFNPYSLAFEPKVELFELLFRILIQIRAIYLKLKMYDS